jgi:hypothetical protein
VPLALRATDVAGNPLADVSVTFMRSLDMRLRMGYGRASGVSSCQGLGTARMGRLGGTSRSSASFTRSFMETSLSSDYERTRIW